MHYRRQLSFLLIFSFFLFSLPGFAQNKTSADSSHVKPQVKKRTGSKKKVVRKYLPGPSSDALLKAAKVAAFKQKNYPKAKELLFRALNRSPNYADIKIFLGRIYDWTNNYDSSKFYFQSVLAKNPANEDAAFGYANLEYFLDHYNDALSIVNSGLKYHPRSKDLISRKKKILAAIKNPTLAKKPLSVKTPSTTLVKINKANPDSLVSNSTLNTSPGNEPAPKLNDTLGNQPPTAIIKENIPEDQKNLVLTTQPIQSRNEKSNISNTGNTGSTGGAGNKGNTNTKGTSTANLDTSSSDDLLILARKAVFDEKNYEKGKGFLYRALKISPTYADVQIFLGRIYTWTNNYDSAKYFFDSALRLKPDYEDAIDAYSDLEYWRDHYHVALGIVESGLRFHPESQDLLYRKAKILTALKEYNNASMIVSELLRINPKNLDALSLRDNIKVLSVKNSLSVGYDFSYFTKQFGNPWHLVGIEYGRVTDLGKIVTRVNLANRFTTNGAQFEVDAYPHISKIFYAYMSLGVPLTNVGIFPNFRAGFSIYANLPASFEAELGFRYLKFSGNPILIYTAYVGKYYKNWLFSERIYLVPSDFSQTISASFTASASYYIGGSSSDDVIGGSIGYGVSPDDRANNIILGTDIQRLGSYKAGVFYKKKISKFDVFNISQGIVGSEYFPGLHGIEVQFGVGITHRF